MKRSKNSEPNANSQSTYSLLSRRTKQYQKYVNDKARRRGNNAIDGHIRNINRSRIRGGGQGSVDHTHRAKSSSYVTPNTNKKQSKRANALGKIYKSYVSFYSGYQDIFCIYYCVNEF